MGRKPLEILIANYDLHEREKNVPSQLNLFEKEVSWNSPKCPLAQKAQITSYLFKRRNPV